MENKNERFWHRVALGSSVSFFLVYTFFLYGPLKLYIENKDTLWFSFDATLIVTLIISVVGFLVITLITSLPKRIIHAGLCCLVFALALGLFIQGNFLNIDYGSGVLDGSEIAWKDYTTYGAINCAVWAACLAFPFAFFMVFRLQWRRILMFSSLGLILVQSVILGSLIVQNQGTLNKTTYEVTREGIYELSEDDNTIVFVLDSFDENYFDKIKKDFPDYKKKLDGFTEYDNALSTASGASVALPSLLTGDVYTKKTSYSDYLDSLWHEDNVYSMLSKEGVDTRVFAQTEYFTSDAKGDIKNIVDYMDSQGAYISLIKTLYKYTAYNYSPHYLKQYFWMDLNTISSYKSKNIYSLNDAKLYSDYVRNEGFSYTDEYKNSVRIYNLVGARSPYTLTKNTIKSINGTTLDDQIYGCFNCLFAMIDDLKENGVYENANIIITANIGNKGLTQHPILLVKQSGNREGYEVSSAAVSLFDFAPTLASYHTDNYSAYGSGKTFIDFSNDANRTRYFYLNTGENNETRIEQYSTRGNADDVDSMNLLDKFYSTDVITDYRMGTSLTFTMDASANMYSTEGFCSTTGWRTPVAGPSAQMRIPIASIDSNAEDIHVFLGVHSVDKVSNCVIYANGKSVFSAKISKSFEKDGINFTVPTSLIDDNNVLTLDFEFTDISNDELELDTNKRTKVISLESFKMYTQ
ncbi:MAG: hypothetical protein IKB73_05960 [Ruminococcus sp.]|nr:hypothetical protein [Ruminococcus sp.]